LAEEDVVVSVVGDTSGLEKSLENVAKQIAKFSRTTTTALENLNESLLTVADAAKGMGSGIATGAKEGVQELKKLEDQAAKTAKNISSSGPSRPLSDEGVIRVQTAMSESPRQAQQQLNAELQREVEARAKIEQAQKDSAAKTAEAAKQQKIQADEAIRAEKAIAQKEKAEAELINKTAIANVLFVKQEKLLDGNATQADIMQRAIGRVTPAVQQAINALPRLRYALFDVARGATVLSAGLTAVALAPVGLAISYQREFADVIRTTGVAGVEIEELRQDFIKLKQDIPISWKEITDIGSLAGQLGISKSLIADFTASVARFAATTDLNVTQSATLFGRLNQLISGVDGQFEKLSAAINRVGVISVATESQIGAVAQNIASIANLSGLAAAEIVGLAGALASLGIAPELARGTVTRLFSNINKSVALGGRNLEEYGRITRRTADEFAQSWKDAPTQTLIDFFAGIDKEGSRAERTLRELGITSVRDIPAILRLAQNQQLVAELVSESVDAFEEGIESQKQYAAITSTLSERLKLLGQNFQLLLAISGEQTAGVFAPLIDKANELVKTLISLTNNDVAKWALFAASAVTLFIAGVAGLIGFLAIVGAKASGLVTALIDMQRALLGTSASSIIAAKGLGGFIAAELKAIATTRLFINTLKGFVIIAAITAAFAAVGQAFDAYEKSQRDATARARDAFGEISSFTEAVRADTEAHLAGADAISVRKIKLQENEDATKSSRKAINAWVSSQKDAKDAAGNLKTALDDQTVAFAENALGIARSLALDPTSDIGALVEKIFNTPGIAETLEGIGFNFNDLILAGFEGRGEEYAKSILAKVSEARAQVETEISRIKLAQFDGTATQAEIASLDALNARRTELLRVNGYILRDLQIIGKGYDDLSESAAKNAAVTKFVTGETEESSAAISYNSELIKELIDDYFGAANAAEKTQSSLSNLGDAFRDVGEEAFGASKEIQNTIIAILEEFPDPSQALNELIGFLNFLASIGVDVTGPAMEYLRDVIFSVGVQSGKTKEEIAALLRTMGSVPVFTNFAEGFNKVGRAAGGASKQVKTFDDQLNELIDTLFKTQNAQQSASDAIFRLGEAFGESGDQALYGGREMQTAIKSIISASSNGEQAVANLAALFGTLSSQSGVSGASLQILRQVIERVGAEAGLSAARIAQLVRTAGAGLTNVALNNFSRGVQAAAKPLRTLVDYANDLSKVFSRAFDIRFKSILKVDEIADSWEQLNEEILETTNNLAKLSADQNVKRYFLSIAEAYGDTLRADVIRAELAEIESEIKKAQDSLSREVVGDSRAARENRKTITELVSKYQDYIASLAESGASQDELRQAVARAQKDFEEQARQLGFSEQVIKQYAVAFDDVRTAIDKVPRNITVEANVDPALQALNELNAALQRNIEAARILNTELGKKGASVGGSSSVSSAPVADPQKEQRRKNLEAEAAALRNRINGLQSQLNLYTRIDPRVNATAIRVVNAQLSEAKNSLNDINRRLGTGTYASGGFTGRGGKFDPAGIVHRGEYVIPKQFVNQSTGMPDPGFLAQLQNGMRSFANGGFVGAAQQTGVMMVELSPYDRKLLADAGNVQLRLNGRVVAEATNANNFNEARRGSN
jgi:TP901 family phage tail tape measure protein